MAVIYVRSTDGSNADNGSTWALAKATLAGAAAIDGVGDAIYVSQSHAENTNGTVTLALAGTSTGQTKVICGNDAAAPPTAVATTAVIQTSHATDGFIRVSGHAYIYGHTFKPGTNFANLELNYNQANALQLYEQCSFQLSSSISSRIFIGETVAGTATEWKNCTLKLGHANQYVGLYGSFHWNGGSVLSGSTSPTAIFSAIGSGAAGCGGPILVENVDLSNFGSTVDLFYDPGTGNSPAIIRNCKLPASWTGDLVNSALSVPSRVEMHNCDSGNTNYRLWVEDYLGSIKSETTIVRTGGASDGVTPLSWKMVSNTLALYPHTALASPEFVVYNSTTGSSKTVTVEIIRDSLTALTDQEAWLEVSYLGDSGSPLGTPANDCKADVLTNAANQTTSAAAWTTTGLTNPNTQKLEVTFTPQKKGYIHCRVMLAKTSATIYVDPKITLS